jgi:alpha-1,6-mannosyltransferase
MLALQPLLFPASRLPSQHMLSNYRPHVLDTSMFWGPAGGVRRTLGARHERLPAHGFSHTVLAPGARGDGLVDCGGITLPGSGGYRVVLSRSRAARLIERQRPDLIEAADPYRLAWASLDAARRLGVPAVAFCHSNLPLLIGRCFTPAFERRVQRYLAHLYEGFDIVLAPSRSMTAALRTWGVRNVQRQPLGVDCTVFCPERRDPAWRRTVVAQLGLPRYTKLLVYVGRFAPEKNLQLLADAVELVGPGHALLLVGSGPCPPRGPGVYCLGHEFDAHALARIVASCDAFVHAGDQETFGLALLEAMACGTPVVACARGGLGELAIGAGYVVDRQRAPLWAQAIAATTSAPNPGLTQTALERARRHDWSAVVASMAQRYARLLSARCPTPSRQGPPLRTLDEAAT